MFLAQNFLLDAATEGEGGTALSQARLLIEGAPALTLTRSEPCIFYLHIDDFGIGKAIEDETEKAEVNRMATAMKDRLHQIKLRVRKEEPYFTVRALGHDLGGTSPCVQADGDKLWLAAERLWHMAVEGRALASQVESVVSLVTWILMADRSALCVLQQTYQLG